MKPIGVLADATALRSGASIVLAESEQHHLRVRRAGPGAALLCYDGQGRTALAKLLADGKSIVVGSVEQQPALPETVLAVGGGDRDRFFALAERCTELGVSRLIPVMTERARHVANRVRDGAAEKGQARAREACKQSGNAWATIVDPVTTLDELAQRALPVRWFLASAGSGRCPVMDRATRVGWIVGPEGGLTDAEAAFCRASFDATPVGFGNTLLRFDTAAIVAAALTHDRRNAGDL